MAWVLSIVKTFSMILSLTNLRPKLRSSHAYGLPFYNPDTSRYGLIEDDVSPQHYAMLNGGVIKSPLPAKSISTAGTTGCVRRKKRIRDHGIDFITYERYTYDTLGGA
ncbi:hypothetical protein HBI11_192740 [Parastagonospora nodorum]|nr:hypothetical protein HBI11_192740 [Parastagonospora nodorum]